MLPSDLDYEVKGISALQHPPIIPSTRSRRSATRPVDFLEAGQREEELVAIDSSDAR